MKLINLNDTYTILAMYEGTCIATEGSVEYIKIAVDADILDSNKDELIKELDKLAPYGHRLTLVKYNDLDIFQLCAENGITLKPIYSNPLDY